jgi:hypothetical protein
VEQFTIINHHQLTTKEEIKLGNSWRDLQTSAEQDPSTTLRNRRQDTIKKKMEEKHQAKEQCF